MYGNSIAASVTPARTFSFPYESILLFESYTVMEDAAGEPTLDRNGRFIPNVFNTVFVMRKERGFGADYHELHHHLVSLRASSPHKGPGCRGPFCGPP